MARSKTDGVSGCALFIGGVLVIGLVVLIIKWAVITAAILAVPFGVWWVYDRHAQARRRRAEVHRPTPVDPAHEARIADDLGLPASAQVWRSMIPADDENTASTAPPVEHPRPRVHRSRPVAGRQPRRGSRDNQNS